MASSEAYNYEMVSYNNVIFQLARNDLLLVYHLKLADSGEKKTL